MPRITAQLCPSADTRINRKQPKPLSTDWQDDFQRALYISSANAKKLIEFNIAQAITRHVEVAITVAGRRSGGTLFGRQHPRKKDLAP